MPITYFPFRWMVGTFQEILDSSSANWASMKSITDLSVVSFVTSCSEAKYSSTELNLCRLLERGWRLALLSIPIHYPARLLCAWRVVRLGFICHRHWRFK